MALLYGHGTGEGVEALTFKPDAVLAGSDPLQHGNTALSFERCGERIKRLPLDVRLRRDANDSDFGFGVDDRDDIRMLTVDSVGSV